VELGGGGGWNVAVEVLLCTRDSGTSFLFANDSPIVSLLQAALKNGRYKKTTFSHIPVRFFLIDGDWRGSGLLFVTEEKTKISGY
jgi:hypothetical protein